MSEKDRKGILSEISNWLKLLGLIVLVSESVIIAAMSTTPKDQAIHKWYPLFMLLFLLVIVVGLFVDRYLKRRSDEILKLKLGDKEVEVNTSSMVVSEVTEDIVSTKIFSDSAKGFLFERPESKGWNKPTILNTHELLIKLGLFSEDTDPEEIKAGSALIPLGKMFIEGFNIIIDYEEAIDCEITDQTSNSVIDTFIERTIDQIKNAGEELPDEAEITALRQQLLLQNFNIKKFKTQNTFAIHAYDKTLAADSPIKPTLPNVFVYLTKIQPNQIDKLVSNDQSILWGTQQTLTNVKIGDTLRELNTFTMNALFENDRYIFELNIVYSPQTDAPIHIWDELKNILYSFKIAAE